MARQKAQVVNLLDLSATECSSWLDTFDTVLTDCDGTLWHDDEVIAGAPQVLSKLQSLGKNVYYITNNGTKTRHEIWQRADRLGFKLSEDDLIAPNYSIVQYLKSQNFNKNKSVYVIGNAAITRELAAAGIESFGTGPDSLDSQPLGSVHNEIATQDVSHVGAVVIGWDEYYSYPKMMKASNILICNPDAHFLATNLDTVHKYPHYHIPGTGAFVRPIEMTVGRVALEMGKPNPAVLAPLLKGGKLQPTRTLMIGDCCKIDVQFGSNCNIQTLLVGTGSYQLSTVKEMIAAGGDSAQTPNYYVPKLGDLLPLL